MRQYFRIPAFFLITIVAAPAPAQVADRTKSQSIVGISQQDQGPASRPAPFLLPADLARSLDEYDRATIAKDTFTLAALVTDDYMLVNSDATVQDKASYLADFLVRGFKIDPYQMELPVFKMFGDTALTGGVFKLGWTLDGRHQSRRLRIAHLWVKRGGRWKIAYTQLTRVPE
ncbi:MAG: nuclear transport factor 2 family protein [Sphingosinicella sp.]|nr:nuclear transport factor 2 family protein [Sphingosinicella sp.]